MSRRFRYDVPLESLREPHQRIYEALYTAAYLGNPCPSNHTLAMASGHPGASQRYASEAVSAIEAAGLIEVHRGYKARIVILATGQSTEGAPADLRPLVRRSAEPPMPSVLPVARTSCGLCGTRSDIGCEHSRRVA